MIVTFLFIAQIIVCANVCTYALTNSNDFGILVHCTNYCTLDANVFTGALTNRKFTRLCVCERVHVRIDK